MRFDSSAGLSDIHFGVLSAWLVMICTMFLVCEGFPALFSLRCRKWIPSNIIFALLFVTFMDITDLSVLAVFFGKEASSSY